MSRWLAATALALPAPAPVSAREAPASMTRFNVECPAPRACGRLERARVACESGKSCGAFLATMERLLPEYDCQRPFDLRHIVPAIWLCLEVKDQTLVHDGFGDALSTLSKLGSRPALKLLASPALRKALDGEYAESYREASDRAERRLLVGDRDTGGPGPYIKGGNFPHVTARASSALRASTHHSFDAGMAVDGKAFTAWCAGSGRGTGEWFQLSLEPPGWHRGKAFCAFEVIPGNTRTQATYLAHARPTRVRIASCRHPEKGFEATMRFSPPEDFNRALVTVEVPVGALDGEGRCVRVTLLELSRDGVEPPCISEMVPRYDCEGAEAPGQQNRR